MCEIKKTCNILKIMVLFNVLYVPIVSMLLSMMTLNSLLHKSKNSVTFIYSIQFRAVT